MQYSTARFQGLQLSSEWNRERNAIPVVAPVDLSLYKVGSETEKKREEYFAMLADAEVIVTAR